MPDFFPNNAAFAVAFLATLAAFLCTASFMDLRTTTIPKWLTLAALPVGIAFNVARMAMIPEESWMSGLLFSVQGFFFGFGIFFLLWILGACGGGDVKLFAVLGAWIGWYNALWVFIFTIAIVALLILFQAFKAAVGGNWKKLSKKPGHKFDRNPKPIRRLLTFALPLTIATALWLPKPLGPQMLRLTGSPSTAQSGGSHAP